MAVKHLEDAIEEAKKELETPTETVEEVETPAEDKPGEEVETPAEDKPAEEPAPAEDKPVEKRDEISETLENTNSVIRQRLARQADKYNKELADRDATIAELKKQFEEFKAQAMPKKVLTRDQFQTDEEFVAALTQQQIDTDRAEQAKLRKEQEAKEAEERAVKEREEADIRQRQERFMSNVNYCFDVPEQRNQFLEKVKTYTAKGLGDLLDACPVASDYLLASPRGPKVLDRLLTDKASFVRVFDPRGVTPMDQYYELKAIEREIYGNVSTEPKEQPKAEVPAPEKQAPKAPKYGKPGAQGQGGSADVFTDPKARRDEVRRLLGY